MNVKISAQQKQQLGLAAAAQAAAAAAAEESGEPESNAEKDRARDSEPSESTAPATFWDKVKVCCGPKKDLGYVPFHFGGDWRRSAIVLTVGFAQGFLGGLFGAGGPILIWFISTYQLPSLESRATFQVSFACEIFIRLIYTYCVQTTNHHVRDAEYGYAFIVIIFTSLSGLALGNYIAKHYLNPSSFAKLLIGLLACGSVLMIIGGLPIEHAATVACAMLSSYAFLAIGTYYRWERVFLHYFCKEHKILHIFDNFIARLRGEEKEEPAETELGRNSAYWDAEDQKKADEEMAKTLASTKRPAWSRPDVDEDEEEPETLTQTRRPMWITEESAEPKDAIPNPIIAAVGEGEGNRRL